MALAPDPEKIGRHAQENGTGGTSDRGQQIVDSEARQEVRDNPPNGSAGSARDVELPETDPGGTEVAEDPAVVDEEAEHQHGFGAGRSRDDQRQVEKVA